MKCKFEHDGDCCNSGSPQYMCKCKPVICNSAVPMTNGDRIRAMTDEELAEENARPVFIWNDDVGLLEYVTSDGERFEDEEEAVKHELDWLLQPAKED